ncbi:hypothetical protein [Nitrosovibrio sp. Nv6]|uniref:hypothetical protein n=1 Tax=Nitrosovibrio sp. Nv6 TaxID=1855340 RepID=UPI0008C5894F|nr:hypothetical protein [Nitrosovibrio sp. Nv6]SEO65662.1 hypothetical protein SAMN05216316_0724 [Nitrosovibrio sp. Nv6]
MDEQILVNKEALRQVLDALMGPPHLILELHALNKPYFPGNPVGILIEEYNKAVSSPPAPKVEPAYAAKDYRTGKFGYIWHEKDDVVGWINLQHQSRDDVTYVLVELHTGHALSDELRKDAEELCDYMDGYDFGEGSPQKHIWDAVRKLLATLTKLK